MDVAILILKGWGCECLYDIYDNISPHRHKYFPKLIVKKIGLLINNALLIFGIRSLKYYIN